jgi:hypothetical protein
MNLQQRVLALVLVLQLLVLCGTIAVDEKSVQLALQWRLPG